MSTLNSYDGALVGKFGIYATNGIAAVYSVVSQAPGDEDEFVARLIAAFPSEIGMRVGEMRRFLRLEMRDWRFIRRKQEALDLAAFLADQMNSEPPEPEPE